MGNQGQAQVISAFPGTGKSYFFGHSDLRVLDSDSSQYSWIEKGVRHPDFPANYMRHIRESLDAADVILVSSHEEVRDALVEEGIPFSLVYPARELRDEYIERFRNRGSPEGFIKLLSEKWDEWISQLETQPGCTRRVLAAGQYLSDIL